MRKITRKPVNHKEALEFLYQKHGISTYEMHYVVLGFIGYKNFHQHIQQGKKVRVPKIGAFTFSAHKARYRKERQEKKKRAKKKLANMIERMKYRRDTKEFVDLTDFF